MPAPAHVQAATLDKFIEGWKKWTYEDMTATWSNDFVQHLLPYSLGVQPKSRAELKGFLPIFIKTMTNYKAEVKQVVHDAARSSAVIYMTSTADTPWKDFKWNNDYSVFVSFTKDGKQVDKMEEMVDSAFFKEFFPRFQQHLSQLGVPAEGA